LQNKERNMKNTLLDILAATVVAVGFAWLLVSWWV
jgi:hypothetical protein